MSSTDGTGGQNRDDEADTTPTASVQPTDRDAWSTNGRAAADDPVAEHPAAPSYAAPAYASPTTASADGPSTVEAPAAGASTVEAPAAAFASAAPGATSAPGAAPTPTAAFAAPVPAPAPAKPARRRKALIITSIAAAVVLGVGGQAAASIAYVDALVSRLSPQVSALGDSTSGLPTAPGGGASDAPQWGTLPDGSGSGSGSGGSSSGSSGGYPGAGDGSTATGQTSTDATASTDAEQVGVVTILTTIAYDDAAQAAGTGMVMTSDGLVLTNNHVIDGSTSIEVTVESTGETYAAELVGTDATADVAVLKLDDASGLDTVQFDEDDAVATGDAVYSVGNASGTGELVTAAGDVTALDESIQVQNEQTGAAESLSGLIEVDADVVPGDSGGPLFDADGEVIGIVTAASSGSTVITGYAVDIDDALAIVELIETGTETTTVQIGYPAFLGLALGSTDPAAGAGVTVGGVFDGMPAAGAGLVAGDVITAVDGTAVTSADALSALIADHEPGDAVTLTWTTTAGASETASVTLVEGPA